MKAIVAALARRGLHPAWLAAGVTFPVLLVAAGMRSMPGVLLVPSAEDLGGDRATVSFAVSVGLALTGLMGPFTAALMQRFGVRKMIPAALILISVAVAATDHVTSAWQLVLSWGLLTGIGTGMLSNVLAAIITGRWFKKNRGLALGLLTAGFQTGTLIFVPLLAYISEHAGWRQASLVVAAAALCLVPVVLLLMPERPSVVGVAAYGGTDADEDKPSTGNPIVTAFKTLKIGVRSPIFWLLAGSFYVCGLSTNGLIGTHLISLCEDHGLPELRGATLLATMGVFDLFGTSMSGWLSDRFDNRKLLAWYFGLRGLALLYLPFSDFSIAELSVFAVFYGLDWIATAPPTVRLAIKTFGDRDGPILYGWITTGHQLGAATAAFGAGLTRGAFGTYLPAFILSGMACVAVAMILVTVITTGRRKMAVA